ncbi:MAG: lantibiotic dehydratase [Lactobacillaceae bacterium]
MNNYQVEDYFMYRSPVGHIGDFLNLADYANPVDLLHKNRIFFEGVFIASPILRLTTNKLEIGTARRKKERSARNTLFQYYSRYNTRSTPFGIFSAVGSGTYQDYDDLANDHYKYEKSVNIDLLWAFKLIDKLEKDPNILINLKVNANNGLQKFKNHWLLDTRTNFGLTKDFSSVRDNIKIQSNEVLDYSISLSQEPIQFKILAEKIAEKFSRSVKDASHFIQVLIQQEILITEVKFSLIEENPLQWIIDILRKINTNDSFINSLLEIKRLIESYEKQELGQNVRQIEKIEEAMSQLVESETYLRVDLYNKKQVSLNQSVKNSLNDALKVLDTFSFNNSNNIEMTKYHDMFISRYGYEQLVPLQLLLNSTGGLGFPNHYNKHSDELIQSKRNKELNTFFLRKIESALQDKQNIVITDSDIKQFTALDTGQLSGELYGFYNSNNSTIEIGSLGISPSLGNTFARFHAKFDKNILKKNTTIITNVINEAFPNSIFVQLNEVPYFGRSANVEVSNDLEVPHLELHNYSHGNSISINDIYVGATNQEIYFYSKENKKRVIFIMNSMFNYLNGSNLLRFLIDVSNINNGGITNIMSDHFNKLKHAPAVIYKNVILRPEMWNLRKRDFKDSDTLNSYLISNKVPSIVRMKFGDHIIYLNLDRKMDLHALYQSLNKNKFIQLLRTDKNHETFEIVAPFVNKNITSRDTLYVPKNIYDSYNVDNKYFFAKVYVISSQQIAFLKKNFVLLMKELNLDATQKWFFVRYQDDNKDSIRIRIEYSNTAQHAQLYLKFSKWAKKAREQLIISGYSISEYFPETYRYGGTKYSAIIHDFFHYDSILSLILINESERKVETQTAASIISLFRTLNLDLKQQKHLISNLYNESSKSKYEKEYHTTISKMVSTLENNELNIDDKYILETIKKLSIIFNQKNISVDWQRILGSLIHMRCNRVYGINSDMEERTMFLVYKVINTPNYAHIITEGQNDEPSK